MVRVLRAVRLAKREVGQENCIYLNMVVSPAFLASGATGEAISCLLFRSLPAM